MAEVEDLRRRGRDRRRRIRAFDPKRLAGVEVIAGNLVRDVGVGGEVDRIVCPRDERHPLRIDRHLEEVREIAVRTRAGREAGEADVRAVDDVIARDTLKDRRRGRRRVERLGEVHLPVGAVGVAAGAVLAVGRRCTVPDDREAPRTIASLDPREQRHAALTDIAHAHRKRPRLSLIEGVRDVDRVAAVGVRDVYGAVARDLAYGKQIRDRLLPARRHERVEHGRRQRKARRMADRDAHFLRALGAVALMAEVHRAVALIDVDVAGGIAADRCDHRRTVRQPAVVGAIQVVLRRRLQAGEVAVAEIDSMVAEEFHPLAIVDLHRRVAGRVVRQRLAAIG